MFKTIVVGTDGSSTADQAVEAAANLARSSGASLHVVTAYRDAPGMGAASGAAFADGGGARAVLHEAATNIAEKSAANWAHDLDWSAYAVGAAAADGILSVATSVGADLIVVGSLGMHGARRVLGSVPNSVAHGADCAVLIVKTDQ